ncbi:2OG-Fe(II) oxygenase [Streptomyces sp. NPDC002138]|uniref:2OG-Fe(II) oxygenase n=1 Tax=Streptomyces sp. NPDC002138 TaxID=3154410 RepID=UPI0033183CBF
MTYVYFFHREPVPFTGGRLRFLETRLVDGQPIPGPAVAEIEPRQNSVVFFPSFHYHEVETVSCPSRRFTDSRFTVNGWFRSA